jgi:hypothetical protein
MQAARFNQFLVNKKPLKISIVLHVVLTCFYIQLLNTSNKQVFRFFVQQFWCMGVDGVKRARFSLPKVDYRAIRLTN